MSKITRVGELEPLLESPDRARAVHEEEVYIPKPGNCPSISGNTGAILLHNPSEETIPESSQMKQKILIIKQKNLKMRKLECFSKST